MRILFIRILPNILPSSFIENFKLIEQNLKNLNWPKNPKIIVTSYDQYFNEAFKIFTSEQIGKGSKFFILQHGHQCQNKFCLTDTFEKKICDKFLTWGNKSKDKKKKFLYLCQLP